MLAHRVSWILAHGEIADDLCVLHRCDNLLCVRPDHLFLGTLWDNTRPFERRFWEKVDKSGECWLWTGGMSPSGYGNVGSTAGNKRRGFATRAAHRISWILTFGEIGDGLCVCHRCDNPPCVNPAHLFLGTHLDNNRDMINKGRDRKNPRRGEAHHQAKLTEDAVLSIRELSRNGVPRAELAARFGVAQSGISKITLRQTWTHI
jgi:hypothetical protein